MILPIFSQILIYNFIIQSGRFYHFNTEDRKQSRTRIVDWTASWRWSQRRPWWTVLILKRTAGCTFQRSPMEMRELFLVVRHFWLSPERVSSQCLGIWYFLIRQVARWTELRGSSVFAHTSIDISELSPVNVNVSNFSLECLHKSNRIDWIHSLIRYFCSSFQEKNQ